MHLLNNVSNSVGSVMKPAGLDSLEGVLSTGYLKDPTDPTWDNDAGKKEWLAFMDKYFRTATRPRASRPTATPSRRRWTQVLKHCDDDLTRENVMKQAASLKDLELPMLLPGITINTSDNRLRPRSSRCRCRSSTASAGSCSAR